MSRSAAGALSQAGGRSTTGAEPIMAIVPDHVHQRVPVFLGSRDDVADLEEDEAERMVVGFTVEDALVHEIDLVADPAVLPLLDLSPSS